MMTKTGYERNDSEVEDSKITVMAGVTPVPELDANITYMGQRANKEAPGDVAAVEPVIWGLAPVGTGTAFP